MLGWVALAGLVGLCIGSFLNVVIHRLPKMMEREWHAQCAELRGETLAQQAPFNLAHPASRCPQCGHRLRAWENIPLLSWLYLRGRCSACGTRIGWRYPLVELLSGAMAALSVWHFGLGWTALAAMGLCWTLIALTFIDLDTQLLPDSMTQPLLWAGLLANSWHLFCPLSDAVFGAMAGYLSLWSVFWLFKWFTGKEGMGYGDFKLLAALGAWFGWTLLPAMILLSSFVGALVGILLILFRGHQRQIPIPFGPYLAGAGLLTLFLGTTLNQYYLGWWG